MVIFWEIVKCLPAIYKLVQEIHSKIKTLEKEEAEKELRVKDVLNDLREKQKLTANKPIEKITDNDRKNLNDNLHKRKVFPLPTENKKD